MSYDSHSQFKPISRTLTEMLDELTDYIKLAVDIERDVIAGGGELHADCKSTLLADGSKQENIWGADWVPAIRVVRFLSFINIRPSQNNPSMEILDPAIKVKVDQIVQKIFG